MIIDRDGGKNWFSAHLFKINHQAVGRTKADVELAFESAKSNGNAIVKWGGLPIGQEAGLSVNKVETWTLKFREIASKLSTVIPIIAGFSFLSSASNILRESNGGPDAILGGVMGIIGLAAITIFPIIGYQSGEALGLMHK